MNIHAAQSSPAQGVQPFGVITPARTIPATTRSQLHAELRETAGAIPIPLSAASITVPEQPTAIDDSEGKTLQAITALGAQQLRDPTLPELMWLGEMRLHLYHPADPPPTAQELSTRFDDFCSSWHTDSRRNRWDCSYAVASLGVGLGDLLVTHLPSANWTIAENGDTAIFAVRDDNRRITYLPLDAVGRRWHAHQLEWIQLFLDQAADPSKMGNFLPPATEP